MKPFYNKKNMYFLSERQIQLINAVKKYPPIYKNKIKKRTLIERCWDSVAEEVNLPAETCKYRWGFIRNGYVKSKRTTTRSKYTDCPLLSFIDSEIGPKRKKQSRLQLDEDVQVINSTSEDESGDEPTDNTINLDDKKIEIEENVFAEYDDGIIKELVSEDPNEVIVPDNHTSLDYKLNIPKPPALKHSVQLPNTDIEHTGKPSQKLEENVNNVNESQSAKSDLITQLRSPGVNDSPTCSGSHIKMTIFSRKPFASIASTVNLTNEVIEECKPTIMSTGAESNSAEDLEASEISNTSSHICKSNIKPNSNLGRNKLQRKDIKTFLSDLSRYVESKFSLEKQEDIKIRICSLMTSEELDDFEKMCQTIVIKEEPK